MYHDRGLDGSGSGDWPLAAVGSRGDATHLLTLHLDLRQALSSTAHVVPVDALLALVEATQDAVDRLGLGGGGTWPALEAMTRLGIEALMVVAAVPASSRAEVGRRARAYARQRCGTAVAVVLAYALEGDRRLHGMGLRDLA